MPRLDTAAVRRVRCRVLQGGEVILDQDVPFTEKGQLAVPQLAEGRYEVAYEMFDEDGDLLLTAPLEGYYVVNVTGDGQRAADAPGGPLRRLFRR